MQLDLINLIKENQDKIYRVAFSYTKNREDALDVVHNSIVKAIQNCDKLREKQYFKTWFYRIVINESITFVKKRQRLKYVEDIDEFESETKGDYLDLYDAIDKLPIKLKSVIILRFFEDLKIEEIAKITSSNVSTTKSRLYKALNILKIDMEEVKYG